LRGRIVGALAAVIVLGLMAAIVISFQEGSRSSAVSGDKSLLDGIRVHANVVKVLPEEDHLVVRLSFEPVGSYVQDQRFLTRPVRVVAVGGAGIVDETFDAGALMPPEDLMVALGGGEVSEYPIDRYESLFQVRVTDADRAVPSVLMGEAAVRGYRLTMTDPLAEPNGGNDMTVDVTRGPATLIFAVFVIVLMWALTLLVLVLAIGQIRSGAPIDGAMISLVGVLLFAFPAIRNSVPDVPPPGVLGDFLSFFWCEIALGIGLVALLIFRIRRRGDG
jgi:hypothetical protein